MPLTPTQRSDFKSLGFIAMEGVLTPAEVAQACAAISDVIARRQVDLDIEPRLKERWETLPDPELGVRKIMFFAKVNPTLAALSRHPRIVGIVEELLGEPCVMAQDMALLKPPGGGCEKPWHQDVAYFRLSPMEKVIGCWIALDPARSDNGCMRVVPRTHLEGPVPHYHLRDCQIPDEKVATDRAVDIPLAPGGMLVFSGLLHHGTAENSSPLRRRALQFHYAAQSCETLPFERHADVFHERDGRYTGCAAWTPEEQAKAHT